MAHRKKQRSDAGFDGTWFPPSVPRKVDGGITTKKATGRIGESWWSRRWIRVLESFQIGARLQRGRSYARQGQVLELEIGAGRVAAQVQGSRVKPYRVDIRLKPLSDSAWTHVVEVMASRAVFAARLLAGEMPHNIEEAFDHANCTLFPRTQDDLETKCSCPDVSNPCKHVAAVYYLLADRFDDDPFLLFMLRGRTKEQIVGALRAQRARSVPASDKATPSVAPPSGNGALPLGECLDRFWQAGGDLGAFAINPARPPIHAAFLKRLDKPPFKNLDLLGELSRAYDVIATAALDRAMK